MEEVQDETFVKCEGEGLLTGSTPRSSCGEEWSLWSLLYVGANSTQENPAVIT